MIADRLADEWFEVGARDGLTVRVRVDHDDYGRPIVTGLTFDGPVMASDLRSLSLAEIERFARAQTSAGPPLALQRPDGKDPAAFYRQVAKAYEAAIAQAIKPAALMIADDAGVPVGTARRWIAEARRRGSLPPGRRGKVG